VNNIAKLGVDLTLGLDSFMFFDDDPINIVSVSSMLPEVLAIRWPESQAEQANVLNHLWALDATSEYVSSGGVNVNALRTGMYFLPTVDGHCL
jgi:predicted enzyme involved in methoxymalonyl-ACP biosynthesis